MMDWESPGSAVALAIVQSVRRPGDGTPGATGFHAASVRPRPATRARPAVPGVGAVHEPRASSRLARAFGDLCLIVFLVGAVPARAAEHGAVATVHPLATRAGAEVLRAGGNAVDAAIACALTLGVVDGFNSGLGGGCFLTLRLADGRLTTIDGREAAPAAGTR